MDNEVSDVLFHGAVSDFRRARRRAALEEALSKLRGHSTTLLSYDDVQGMLQTETVVARGLQDIPLAKIVGSVGRPNDFTRTFLPRQGDEERWARVKIKMNYQGGLPPIEVYQIGEVYFVLDGNHRVSVARESGATHIQAYVTEIESKFPVSSDMDTDALICRTRYAEFLQATELDKSRKKSDLYMSVCGRYRDLEEHIHYYRYLMSQELGREVSLPEAAAQWYDTEYLPVVQIIRERGMLRDFPDRTEADLYLWLVEWQDELEKELGWHVEAEEAAAELAHEKRPLPLLARVGERIREAMIPESLETGPAPGHWRQERVATRRQKRLFIDVMAFIEDTDPTRQVSVQATTIARREQGRVHGLYHTKKGHRLDEERQSQLRQEFDEMLDAAAVPGELVFGHGWLMPYLVEHARWYDLLVVKLDFPPEAQAIARLNNRFGRLLRRCGRPVLAVPHTASPMLMPIVAYDGSPKAQEALFVAAYMASKWGVDLGLVMVKESQQTNSDTLNQALDYLAQFEDVVPTVYEMQGEVGPAILQAAAEHDSDLIIMGGYGFNSVLEVMLGSSVDYILREADIPILICR